MSKSLIDFASPTFLLVFFVLFPTLARAAVIVEVKGNSADYKFSFQIDGDTLSMKPYFPPAAFPQGGDSSLTGSITLKFTNPGAPPPTIDLKFSINESTRDDGLGLMDPVIPIPPGAKFVADNPIVDNAIEVLPKPPTDIPGPLPLLGVGAAFSFSRRLKEKMSREVKLITPD
jgi:hypothetical protein